MPSASAAARVSACRGTTSDNRPRRARRHRRRIRLRPAGGAASPSAGIRRLGPIAGLAAGGLLAAMFMGGAFDGIKPFVIVLLLGIAALIVFIIRAMRARAPAAAHNIKYAGHGH